ncbi:MAG: M4 family metallopeptidase [Anaerolineae bacterium]|nr:M4 family metallopeptidase [Anaerolineae bacterium]
MCNTGPCHPIQCIIPPHMLQEIAENGTEKQKEWAIDTLTVSEQFRGQRNATPQFSAMRMGALDGSGLKRIVYDAQFSNNLPGVVARSEGDEATGDLAVDDAYDGAGATYDYYVTIHNRDSIDGRGMALLSTVHFGAGYDNAFWNGKQMVYGDGDEDLPEDQRLFNRFTASLDIIAHELTHGVTQYESQLVYFEQSGALNEALSDIFGILVKQYVLKQTADEADWIIGAELFSPNVNGVGIRSMKAPGTAYNDPVLGRDPQPAHMDDYRNVSYDNGGVHINSGIPNHAFYVMAREMGGFAWEKAGQIWYIAQRDQLDSKANFQTAANVTYQVAANLYGKNSLEQQAVQTGWQEVGILIPAEEEPTPTPTPTPDPIPEPQGCRNALLELLTGKHS